MSPLIGKPIVGLPSDEVSPDPPQADRTNIRDSKIKDDYMLPMTHAKHLNKTLKKFTMDND